MKKPALLLSLFMVLLALPAQAEMIVNDHFDGSDIDSSWNITMISNTTGWNYQVQDSQLTVNQIGYVSGASYAGVRLTQDFNPIDDFTANFQFSWAEVNLDTIRNFGISLYDSDHNKISIIGNEDGWLGGLGTRCAVYADSFSRFGTLPLTGSGTASMVRRDGLVSFYWNDVLLMNAQLLDLATTLELYFSYHPMGGRSQLGTVSIDYVTLEGDPVDLSATPEPGTMMLLGSALGLGAWWHRRRKSIKRIQA